MDAWQVRVNLVFVLLFIAYVTLFSSRGITFISFVLRIALSRAIEVNAQLLQYYENVNRIKIPDGERILYTI